MMKAIETQDFSTDIASIDSFLEGKIIQDTWQKTPIELNGKQYIKHKPIINDWLKGREVLEIEIPIPDEEI